MVKEKIVNCEEIDSLLEYILLFENIDFSDIMDIKLLIDKMLNKNKQSKQLVKMIQQDKYQKYQSYIFQNYNNNYYVSFLADIIVKLNLNKANYPHVQKNLQKSFVRYYIRSFEWQRVEQKLQTDPLILAYAIEELYRSTSFDILHGIISRQNLLDNKCITNKQIINKYHEYQNNNTCVQNDLYTKDCFTDTEKFFITKQQPQQKQTLITVEYQKESSEKVEEQMIYMELQQYKMKEEDVIFINNCKSKDFQWSTQELLNSSLVGLDSEFTNTYTKLDKAGEVALLQLSTDQHIFLFDFLILKTELEFIEFLSEFMSSKQILKIGHSLSADISQLNNSLELSTGIHFNYYLDIAEVFKANHSGNKSSLQYMVNTLLHKQFSKFEQCSNWQVRPLRQSQIHYAALDAYVCLLIYKHFAQINIQFDQFIHYTSPQEVQSQCSHNKNNKLQKVYNHQPLQDIFQKKCKNDKNKYFQNQIENFQVIFKNEQIVKNFDQNEKLSIAFDDLQSFSLLEFFLKNVKEQLNQFDYVTSIITDQQSSYKKLNNIDKRFKYLQ